MSGFVVIRTFIAGLLLPGLGFVLVNRLRLGIVCGALFLSAVIIFPLSRVIVVPAGWYAMMVCLAAIRLWSAIHSAWVAYRSASAAEATGTWKKAAAYAAVLLAIWLPLHDRATYLGYETFRIPSNSMAPTLVSGDYILSDTWHYVENEPKRGDIVVFLAPPESSVTYMKRVVGLPGDEVTYERHRLTINGTAIDLEKAANATREVPRFIEQLDQRQHEILITNPAYSYKEGTYHIPAGHYFLMGDNRDNTLDSRFFGSVPRDKIRGYVSHLWYSSANDFPIVF